MKAYGYIRVSTDEQARQGASLDAQNEAIERYCSAHDIELTETICDPGITGTSLEARPRAKALIERICKERAILVVYKLDRLFRNGIEGILIEKGISDAGASLVSLSEHIDTSTADGWFIFWIRCGMTESEPRRIRERTSFTLRWKRDAGQRVSHCATFGHRLVNTGKLNEKTGKPIIVQEPDEREQEAIALMVQLKQQSYGYRAIGRRLSKLGYLSRTGNIISGKVIRSVLDRQTA